LRILFIVPSTDEPGQEYPLAAAEAIPSDAETIWLWNGDLDRAERVFQMAPRSAVGTVSYVLRLSELARKRRDYDEVVALQNGAPFEWYHHQHISFPRGLLAAKALRLKGDDQAASATLEGVRAEIEAVLEKWPEDYCLHSSLGLALAGLGRTAEAMAAARKAVDMEPVEREAEASQR
jgi:tetratricopeptide (TPR) repeat protein